MSIPRCIPPRRRIKETAITAASIANNDNGNSNGANESSVNNSHPPPPSPSQGLSTSALYAGSVEEGKTKETVRMLETGSDGEFGAPGTSY
ncbi:hypothetical protein ANO14919_004480 [Xylariales sp. No.14919]|nr:hypothetical protein ANO14919_004480 [Xylariales sp. No.14919]